MGSVLSSYGWYMLLAAVAVYFLVQKVSRSLAWSGGRPGAAEAAEGEYRTRCGVSRAGVGVGPEGSEPFGSSQGSDRAGGNSPGQIPR